MHNEDPSIEALVRAGVSSMTQSDRPCPFCYTEYENINDMHLHVAYHLERFSIFALPRSHHLDKDKDVNDGEAGSNDANTQRDQSLGEGDSTEKSSLAFESQPSRNESLAAHSVTAEELRTDTHATDDQRELPTANVSAQGGIYNFAHQMVEAEAAAKGSHQKLDISQLTEVQQSALQTYTSVTNQETLVAIPVLQRAKWDVSIAISRFFDGEPASESPAEAVEVLQGTEGEERPDTLSTMADVVNVVCSDKTGTLTLNHMTVTKIWHFDANHPFGLEKDTASPPASAVRTVLRVGNIANNARLSSPSATSPATAACAAVLSSTQDQFSPGIKSRWTGQPTDVAVLDLLDMFGEDDVRDRIGPRVAETPFSSERKWMGVVIGSSLGDSTNGQAPGPEVAYIKGALEQVLDRCDTYLTKDGREVILDEARKQEAFNAAATMADEGLRVIGFASGHSLRRAGAGSRVTTLRLGVEKATSHHHQQSLDEDNLYSGLCFAGMVGMSDPPRKDVHKHLPT